MQLHQMFMDMSILVQNQGELLNQIEYNVGKVNLAALSKLFTRFSTRIDKSCSRESTFSSFFSQDEMISVLVCTTKTLISTSIIFCSARKKNRQRKTQGKQLSRLTMRGSCKYLQGRRSIVLSASLSPSSSQSSWRSSFRSS